MQLTPGKKCAAEHEVVRLVCDGLPDKNIATRLFG
jgi:DNA-binding NarL/FixJ family response regulator